MPLLSACRGELIKVEHYTFDHAVKQGERGWKRPFKLNNAPVSMYTRQAVPDIDQ
jgi:hypothetical protein